MINHARTLLLNQTSKGRPRLGEHGEEFIPTNFGPKSLPPHLKTIRQILLGSFGDPTYQNYRLAQYMSMLHSYPMFEELVLGYDPRITYTPGEWGLDQLGTGVSASAITPTAMTISVSGDPKPDDALGRLANTWFVTTESGPQVRVTNYRDKSEFVEPVTVTGQQSSQFEIGFGLSGHFIVPAGTWQTGITWTVMSVTRPGRSLTDILDTINESNLSAAEEIFPSTSDPYRSKWKKGHNIVEQLGGLIAGWIRAAEALDG